MECSSVEQRHDFLHSYDSGRIEYNGGGCDGWLRAGGNDEYPIGYYTKKDLGFFAGAATRWGAEAATCTASLRPSTTLSLHTIPEGIRE